MNNRFPLGRQWWALCFSLSGFVTVIDAVKRHATATQIVATSAAVMVFIGIFFSILVAWQHGRSGLWQAIAITLIGALFAPFNGTAWIFFAVAAALAPVVADGQIRQVVTLVSGIIGVALVEKLMLGLPWSFVGTVAGYGIPTAAMCTLTLRRGSAVRELARHSERERIARDMHDVLGHTLSVIILKIDLAARLARTDPERVIRELTEADRIARETLDEVRATLRGYRARSLEHEFELARHTLVTAGIAVTTQFEALQLDPTRENTLCLALREAVTNVVRHALAKHCQLSVKTSAEHCVLEIQDDGISGLTNDRMNPANGPGGGLEGMRERVSASGGTVTQRVDRGTRLTISVPLATGAAQ